MLHGKHLLAELRLRQVGVTNVEFFQRQLAQHQGDTDIGFVGLAGFADRQGDAGIDAAVAIARDPPGTAEQLHVLQFQIAAQQRRHVQVEQQLVDFQIGLGALAKLESVDGECAAEQVQVHITQVDAFSRPRMQQLFGLLAQQVNRTQVQQQHRQGQGDGGFHQSGDTPAGALAHGWRLLCKMLRESVCQTPTGLL